jgi:hypothetical protein
MRRPLCYNTEATKQPRATTLQQNGPNTLPTSLSLPLRGGGAIDLYNQGVIGAEDLKASADLLKALRAEMARNKAARIVEAEAALVAVW